MLNLQEVKEAVEQFSPEELHELQLYIEQQALKQALVTMLAGEAPEILQSGTMNIERLQEAVQGMWEGLSEHEINTILSAMNEKNVKLGQNNG